MAAATDGYRSIDDPTSAKTTSPTPAHGKTVGTLANSDDATLRDTITAHAASRMHAVARGAGAAASGARDAMAQLISAPMPDVNLYTEPLNPSAQLTWNDRLHLVLESCRPWPEFFDLKAMNAPAASEAKLRIGHNVEIFFYNYLVVGLVLLALTALFHPARAFLLLLVVAAAILMYILFPEEYRITDSFYVTRTIKHIAMAAIILLVLTVGHVLSLLLLFACFFLPVVLIHAFVREHSATISSTI